MADRAPFFALTPGRANAAVVDEWSILHFGSGFLAGLSGMSGWTFLFLALGYEVVEYAHEHPSGSFIFGTKGPEWDVNVAADLALSATGFALAAWLSGRKMAEPPRALTGTGARR